MEVWYNFSKKELVLEPTSKFELSFLSDLLGDNDRLGCTTMVDSDSNEVIAITIKPQKDPAHTSDTISATEIDQMYKKMEEENTK